MSGERGSRRSGGLGRAGLLGVWLDRLTGDTGWSSANWLLLGPGRGRRDDGGRRSRGALIREFGSDRYHEPQEHHPISEQPIDADNHAIKALCYWLYDRFGAVRPRGPRRSIPFRIVTD